MAEAFAIVGLVAAISQFVAHGTRIFERMKEFNTNVKEVPETFRAIKTELPLLVDILRRTKRQAEKGDISKNTQQALEPVVESCVEQVEVLDAILAKVLPATGDSSWNRWMKALTSVRNEKKIDKVVMTLRNYVQILTYHQATGFVVSKEYLGTIADNILEQHYEDTSTSGPIEATSQTAEFEEVGEGDVAGNNLVQRSSDSSSITSNTDIETSNVAISGLRIAVVPIAHGRFDAYAAGSDGAVYVFPLEELEQQKTTRWQRLGDLEVDKYTSVSVVSTSKGTLLVGVMDPNGRLYITVGQIGWNHHHKWMQAEGLNVNTNARITLTSRADEQVEAFVVGCDNRVWTLEYDLRNGIDRGWHVIGDLQASSFARITPLRKQGDVLELLTANDDGSIFSASSNKQSGDIEWSPWTTVADRLAEQLTSIEVVATSSNTWSAFIIGQDYRVWTTSWASGELDWDWQPVGDLDVFSYSLFVVLSSPKVIDISVLAFDGTFYTTSLRPDLESFTGWRPFKSESTLDLFSFLFPRFLGGLKVFFINPYALRSLMDSMGRK
jgi:hypothetical protein